MENCWRGIPRVVAEDLCGGGGTGGGTDAARLVETDIAGIDGQLNNEANASSRGVAPSRGR
jgi:hypothetical protein